MKRYLIAYLSLLLATGCATTAEPARVPMSEQPLAVIQAGADKGNAGALVELANRYATGKSGVEKDEKLALSYYQKAADQGNAGAQAQIANTYMSGKLGVKKDAKKAFDYAQKSAQGSNRWGQYLLAKMYASGFGTKKNLDEAYVWSSISAGKGFEAAKLLQQELGSKIDQSKLGALDARAASWQPVKP